MLDGNLDPCVIATRPRAATVRLPQPSRMTQRGLADRLAPSQARGLAMPTRRHVIAISAASVFAPAVFARAARAAAYPDRPIRMIVPVAAGGPTDTNGRILADEMSKILGQKVAVENKGGAATNLGSAYVAHSEADGYTLLSGTSSLASNRALYRTLDYSPTRDLAPVSLVTKFPLVMFVPNSSPAKTVQEFIDDVTAHPGQRVMASPGTGGGPYLAEMYFLQMAHLQMTHAPYHGAAPAFIDLIPGRVNCYFGSDALLSYSRSSKVRLLASTGAKRSPATPNVPTIGETVHGYDSESWEGIFAPAKTPPEIIEKLNAAIVKALAEKTVIEKLANGGYTAAPMSPDELGKFLAADTAKWEGVITKLGLKIG